MGLFLDSILFFSPFAYLCTNTTLMKSLYFHANVLSSREKTSHFGGTWLILSLCSCIYINILESTCWDFDYKCIETIILGRNTMSLTNWVFKAKIIVCLTLYLCLWKWVLIKLFYIERYLQFLLSLFLHLKICILFFICCWYTEMHLAFITHTHPSSSLNSFPNSNNLLWIIFEFFI